MNKPSDTPRPQVKPDWREQLTDDDLAMVAQALDEQERWRGAQNNSPYLLIAKLYEILVNMQDKESN